MEHLWKAELPTGAPDETKSPKGAPVAPFSKSTRLMPPEDSFCVERVGGVRPAGSKPVWGGIEFMGLCERADDKGETEKNCKFYFKKVRNWINNKSKK